MHATFRILSFLFHSVDTISAVVNIELGMSIVFTNEGGGMASGIAVSEE